MAMMASQQRLTTPILEEATTTSSNWLNGTEYQTHGGALHRVADHNPPYVDCHVTTRSAQLMIPGTVQCSGGWTLEYAGWLVSGHYSHKGHTMYVCLDKDAVYSASTWTGKHMLYHIPCCVVKCDAKPWLLVCRPIVNKWLLSDLWTRLPCATDEKCYYLKSPSSTVTIKQFVKCIQRHMSAIYELCT